MGSTRLATPLFGALARTAQARSLLTPERLQVWVGGWTRRPDPADWWIEPEAGVALFRPECVLEPDGGGAQAALAVRGAIVALGAGARPRPGEGGSAALLRDMLTRAGSAVEDLRGQFSLSVWDPVRGCLMLARDHLGQRSIFIRSEPELLLFCSELSPLLRGAGAGCELDRESAVWYLALGMAPPNKTLAAGVTRIPAGHLAIWRPGGSVLTRRYWTPLVSGAPRDIDSERVVEIRSGINRAVALRLDSETRPGLLLSGGLDSTYLSATTRALRREGPLHAFTAAFDAPFAIDETPFAEAVAQWLELDHHVVHTTASEALDTLDSVVLSAAEPCAAWAALIHFRLLARAQQANVKRVLSGLGADEIFGGYDQFRGFYARYLRYARRVERPANGDPFDGVLAMESQSARRLLFSGIARFFDDAALRDGLHEPFRRWHYAPHARAFYRECRELKPEAEVMEMMVAHECQHRIPELLHAGFEPISRRLGIQVEYPFLDPDVIRLVAGLSAESRYRTASGRFSLRLRDLDPRFKHAMLQVAEDRVPTEVRSRLRKSLTAPFGHWMSDPRFGPPVLDRLSRSRFWEAGVVKREWLDRVLERAGPWPSPWLMQLWSLVTLAAWYDRFVACPPRGTPIGRD